ncbi:hypothetical protein CTEN210_02619 [Chaetoceros tenuissimus]|uniref:Ribosomal protein L1 n=1 Tax=Chaetoceros tenuissimus TaxID=426638 RepID=A0AAD3H0S2_9STRA|nr:hypothetical protein CTEN210_02619 [Chaetoceros tenuissimus]
MVATKFSAPAVDSQLVNKAVSALIKHHSQSSNKSALLGDDLTVQVDFTLARIPEQSSPRPIRVEVPHPLHKVLNKGESDEGLEEVEVCLIVKDESKEWVKELIEKFPEDMGYVKKVLTLTSLRKKYTQYKDRRELCKSYGVFLADDRILPMLGKALGKSFFAEKKQPVPIKLSRKEALPFAIKKCLRSTFMYINPGTLISVKAGNTGMPIEHLAENAAAIVENAVQKIPRKWANICAIHIKTSHSVALPIYNKTREQLEEISQLAKVDSNEKKRSRDEEEQEAAAAKETKKKQKKELQAKSPLVKALKKSKKQKEESEEEPVVEETPKKKKKTKSEEKVTATPKSLKKKKKAEAEEEEAVVPTPKSSKKKKSKTEDEPTSSKKASKEFIASKKFKGAKKGYVFKMGTNGVGYYVDVKPVPDKMALAALARSSGAGGSRRKSTGGSRKSGRKGRRSY